MTNPLLGGSSSKTFEGFGCLSLSQFRHAQDDYSYITTCVSPLSRKHMEMLQFRLDGMHVKFNWGRYVR
jgi:hypothetical protein